MLNDACGVMCDIYFESFPRHWSVRLLFKRAVDKFLSSDAPFLRAEREYEF